MKYIDDVLLILGIVLISIGVFKIYIPAGYITLGACLVSVAFLIAKRGITKNVTSKSNKQ